MYEGYVVYGPYGKRRKIIVLVSPEHRTTISYARYLMSLKLGRKLTAEEEVDHIDDDCTNDDIDNLQILTPRQNREKQDRLSRERSLVTLCCPQCGNLFTRPRPQVNRGSSPSCCTRSCGVRYQYKVRRRVPAT